MQVSDWYPEITAADVNVRVSPLVTCLAMAQNLFSSKSKDSCTPIAKNRNTHSIKIDAGYDGLCRGSADLCAALVRKQVG